MLDTVHAVCIRLPRHAACLFTGCQSIGKGTKQCTSSQGGPSGTCSTEVPPSEGCVQIATTVLGGRVGHRDFSCVDVWDRDRWPSYFHCPTVCEMQGVTASTCNEWQLPRSAARLSVSKTRHAWACGAQSMVRRGLCTRCGNLDRSIGTSCGARGEPLLLLAVAALTALSQSLRAVSL